jgi:DNA-binding NarL/FixJ family response regulator
MTRVLVVDDHDFFRSCVVDLIDSTPDLVTVGQCRDGSEVLGAARALQPDVVLMDVRMRVRNGLEAASDLHRAGLRARVILLTSDPCEQWRAAAEAQGVLGYQAKGAEFGGLLHAVRRVAGGGTAWPEDVATQQPQP